MEVDPEGRNQLISLMPGQAEVHEKGGTMRLGPTPASWSPGTLAHRIYGGAQSIGERHRHRYEVNNKYREHAGRLQGWFSAA